MGELKRVLTSLWRRNSARTDSLVSVSNVPHWTLRSMTASCSLGVKKADLYVPYRTTTIRGEGEGEGVRVRVRVTV